MGESKPTDGGPAFPVHSDALDEGLSLRDWFAGQALAGILANSRHDLSESEAAAIAYEVADAMLEVRAKL